MRTYKAVGGLNKMELNRRIYFYMTESCAEYRHPKSFIISITINNNTDSISSMAQNAFKKYCNFENFTNHVLLDYTYLGDELSYYEFI